MVKAENRGSGDLDPIPGCRDQKALIAASTHTLAGIPTPLLAEAQTAALRNSTEAQICPHLTTPPDLAGLLQHSCD